MKSRVLLVLVIGLALVMVTNQSWAAPSRIISLEDLTADGSGHGKVSIHSWEPNWDIPDWSIPYLNVEVHGGELHSGTEGFNAIYVIFPLLEQTYRVYNFSPGQNQKSYNERWIYLWDIPNSELLFTEDIVIEIRREMDDGIDSTDVVLRGSDSGSGGAQVFGAPTDLQVESTTQDSVTLFWTDNATNEIGFHVERAPTSVGSFTSVATLGQDQETYTQLTLEYGRHYYYRVCAFNENVTSLCSDVVLATTQNELENEGPPLPAVDDSLNWFELYANDPNGYWNTLLSYNGPGWDGEWGTQDDRITYCTPTRNPDNIVDYTECYDHPGIDGDWFTDDDIIRDHSTYTYDSMGNRIQKNRYNDPGPDGIWETSDDLMNRYELWSYNSNNRRTRHIRYTGAGDDGDWFTSDDVVYRTRKWSYDPDGKATMRIESRHPGIDGIWFTSDDIIYNYRLYEHDSNGVATRALNYNKGSDGTWFTDDDEPIGSMILIYDSNNYLLGEYGYGGPGEDGVWFQ